MSHRGGYRKGGGGGRLRPGFVVCALHGKMRQQTSMKDNGNGAMECLEGEECKIPENMGVCSVHAKVRGLDYLEDIGGGKFECIEGNKCIATGEGPPAASSGGRREPSSKEGSTSKGKGRGKGKGKGRPARRNFDDEPSEQKECSEHGKVRNVNLMEEDGQGGWRCLENFKCRGEKKLDENGEEIKVQTEKCGKHGKMRNVDFMRQNDDGEWECDSENECKVDSGVPTSGKRKGKGKKRRF